MGKGKGSKVTICKPQTGTKHVKTFEKVVVMPLGTSWVPF